MIKKLFIPILYIFIFSNISSALGKEFHSFSTAKKHLISQVTNETKTIYCDCAIQKNGKKLTPITDQCGYKPRLALTRSGKVNERAKRIEWEHIVPAWEFGHQLQCWQNGGRKNCRKNSEKFKKMEADINNLVPAIGEINGDRSNFRFGMLANTPKRYGSCAVKIDFKQRVIEPPVQARKRIAEAYFYMHSTYCKWHWDNGPRVVLVYGAKGTEKEGHRLNSPSGLTTLMEGEGCITWMCMPKFEDSVL